MSERVPTTPAAKTSPAPEMGAGDEERVICPLGEDHLLEPIFS